jgi:Fe-S-cluster containining protein
LSDTVVLVVDSEVVVVETVVDDVALGLALVDVVDDEVDVDVVFGSVLDGAIVEAGAKAGIVVAFAGALWLGWLFRIMPQPMQLRDMTRTALMATTAARRTFVLAEPSGAPGGETLGVPHRRHFCSVGNIWSLHFLQRSILPKGLLKPESPRDIKHQRYSNGRRILYMASCERCDGGCCRIYVVPLTHADIKRLASCGLDPVDFVGWVSVGSLHSNHPDVRLDDGYHYMVMKRGPDGGCVLAKAKDGALRCSKWGAHPALCRMYPFTFEGEHTKRRCNVARPREADFEEALREMGGYIERVSLWNKKRRGVRSRREFLEYLMGDI